MPFSIMFHLPFRLPTAALLHIGQWAISRRLDLAHCPICWVPPTHPKQMRTGISIFLSFVLLQYPLLVNCVKSYIFRFNSLC